VAIRLLRRALAESGASPPIAPAASPSRGARALVVGPDHRWFALGDGPEVDLATRAKLRRVLAVLVAQRLSAPGVGVPAERLFEVGWPAERALPKAANDRIYNAIATLRRIGLEGVLKRQDDGYLIDPAVFVERR